MSAHNANLTPNDAQIDDPEPGSTWFVSIVGSIIFVVIVFAVSVLYFHQDERKIAEVDINVPVAEYERGKLAQKEKLAQNGTWIEEALGEKEGEIKKTERRRIPIDDAMSLVGAELSGTAGGRK